MPWITGTELLMTVTMLVVVYVVTHLLAPKE